MKKTDRLNISKKTREIIGKIDKTNFLELSQNNTSRSMLFNFAMALGLDTIPTPIKNIEGLMLDGSISSQTKALMYAYTIFRSNDKHGLQEVGDKSFVYNEVQELANTGFEVIEDYIDNKNEEESLWELIRELDSQFYVK
ncbi:hypothetical protein EZV73_10155 [Acidaminobacter sp. JC074]|uniref:hypothetical protein n=1 Tax=Acidaminobacter sp. JC074 TaxID=2530199 RepID=UPI001F0F496A|nr:hypothetical protein [Acidaminobacter sp. JC074]MCH4887937.1 hypothetical protein [Acidaminobacter sp. JC074]